MVEAKISDFTYKFPKELIANKPASPRDSARLLVYDRALKKTLFDKFNNLPKYLPKNCVLVLNQTKVLPARLTLLKQTGGIVNVLYVRTEGKKVIALSNKTLIPGSKLFSGKKHLFTAGKRKGSLYELCPEFPISSLNNVLEKYGTTPLPPYIKNSSLSEKELKKDYQTVFAKVKGSVAAPTASLHFTKRLISKIKKSGIQIIFVTLHVNLGTFATLTEDQIRKRKLHSEWYEISPAAAKQLVLAKKKQKKIIAVGTTVVRTLESAVGSRGELVRLNGFTNLFIQGGYDFRFVDGIITNFHVPGSSLLMLVSALVGRKKLLSLYKLAIQMKFKLFSFGDGMLIK